MVCLEYVKTLIINKVWTADLPVSFVGLVAIGS